MHTYTKIKDNLQFKVLSNILISKEIYLMDKVRDELKTIFCFGQPHYENLQLNMNKPRNMKEMEAKNIIK